MHDPRSLPLLLFVVAMGTASPSAQSPLDGVARAVEAACLRHDRDALLALQDDLRPWLDEEATAARAHYLLGLAGWMGHLRLNAAPDNGDPEACRAGLAAAAEHLAAAHRARPEDPATVAAVAFCAAARLQAESLDPRVVFEEARAALAKAASPNAAVVLIDAMMQPPPHDDAGMQRIREAMDAAASRARAELETADAEAFWPRFALAMVARNLLFMPTPEPAAAAAIAEELLETAPEFRMARDFLVPFGKVREPVDVEPLRALDWERLAEDDQDDGKNPALPDATNVDVCRDDGEDLLWVRIELAHALPERAFGANLVFDALADDAGGPWWGEHREFLFDRLVTVWVARDHKGQWRGAVGVAGADRAPGGAMTALDDGGVRFAIDTQAPALVLGVPRRVLGDAASARMVAAVGSNAQWNDDAPSTGPVAVRLR